MRRFVLGRLRAATMNNPVSMGPLLSILPNGPTAGQIAAGSLTGTKGQTVSCSRAGVKNVISTVSSGVTQLGNNTPAVDTVGLLVEPAVTNLCNCSQTLATNPWGNTVFSGSITATNNTTDCNAPDGTATATKVSYPAVSSGGGGFAVVRQSITVSNSTVYTVSGWVRGNNSGSGTIWIGFYNGSVWSTVACAVGGTTWTRFSVTAPATTSTGGIVDVGVNTNVAGETSQSAQVAYVWGVQLEASPAASSYVACPSAAVTRVADDCSVANPLRSGTLNWSIGATINPLGLSGTQGILAAGSGANSFSLSLTSSGKPTFTVTDNSSNTLTFTATSAISLASHRIVAYNANGTLTINVDGSSVPGSTSGSGTGVITTMPGTLLLGETATGGTNDLNGEMYSIAVQANLNLI